MEQNEYIFLIFLATKNVNRSQDGVARVLEKDTGNYSVQRNGAKMGKEIIKRRNELGLTQKDLGLVCLSLLLSF